MSVTTLVVFTERAAENPTQWNTRPAAFYSAQEVAHFHP